MSGAIYVSICHYVDDYQRTAWESYMGLDESNYLVDSYEYFESVGAKYSKQSSIHSSNSTIGSKTFEVNKFSENGTTIPEPDPGPYLVRFFES
jgi:hypothetical protein